MRHLPTLLLLLLVAACAMGYAFYHQHRAQTQLNSQLYQLDQLLTADNDDAHRRTEGNVKGIEAAVIKNQSQPQDVLTLTAARNLHGAADSVALMLRELADKLRRPVGNANRKPTPAELSKIGEVERLLGPTRVAYRSLQKQLAAYRAALQAIHPTGKAGLSEPQFVGLPIVAALASLSQLESEVRASELQALQYVAPRVGARRIEAHLVALYSAESNMVAPGKTYRAQLFLGGVFDLRPLALDMRCNGQPVSIDSNGTGQVRFRVPMKPGPAFWTGTIHFNNNGRDTTFRVRVPYQVARR